MLRIASSSSLCRLRGISLRPEGVFQRESPWQASKALQNYNAKQRYKKRSVFHIRCRNRGKRNVLFLAAADGLLDGGEEDRAIAGGFLLAHAGDVEQLVGAERLFLYHLPEGGIAEHEIGRDLLLAGQPLA